MPDVERANERQVGGAHYKQADGSPEHWDLIELYGIGYLEGCATKYVARWRQKGGLADLQKADHYIQKLIELHEEHGRRPRGIVPWKPLGEFTRDMHVLERGVIHMLCRWDCRAHLDAARKDLADLMIGVE